MYKICYIVTIPSTIEAFFVPQLRCLSENGFDVTVICSESPDLQEKLGLSICFKQIKIPRGISVFGMLKATYKLIVEFKKNRYDVVQYSTPNASFCAALASKIACVKVRNYHLMGFRYIGSSGIKKHILKLFEKITCQLSTSIECVSFSNLKFGIDEKIFGASKACVVWNGSSGGVDLTRFNYMKREIWRKELREKFGYTDKDFIYGFVGRITGDKGINELLEAFFSLNMEDSKLFIIGNIENIKSIDSLLWKRALKSSKVRIHQSVKDIERYYALMDVLILPSYREGFGNVVIEAAAVGTPAIVTNIPGPIDAVLKNQTALVCKVKDVDDLTNAMKNIHKDQYNKMGLQAHKYVMEKFDSTILCDAVLKRKKLLVSESN